MPRLFPSSLWPKPQSRSFLAEEQLEAEGRGERARGRRLRSHCSAFLWAQGCGEEVTPSALTVPAAGLVVKFTGDTLAREKDQI